MPKQKLNMTIGRFQPFTQGHLNMVNEGEGPCIVYRINSSDKEIERKYDRKKVFTGIKIGSKSFTKDSVSKVVDFINKPDGELSETEKELLKRPFTNALIEKELNIVKKNNPNIIDIIYVTNAYEAFALFNKFILDNQDKYEPQYWMCGDDRMEDFTNIIDKDEEIAITRGGQKYPNVCKGKLKVNIGKGRTEGVSGTEVRKSILNNDKTAFERIMPKGVGVMFKDFVDAFSEFKGNLQEYIKESHKSLMTYITHKSLMTYIKEHISNKYYNSLNNFISESLDISNIMEGGSAGHMAHPFDYTDFSANDLMELVDSLFGGKVEHMKEKLDGFQIEATMNDKGEVVFIRNNEERNSENGGITIEEMYKKWEGKDQQIKVYTQSGKIIEQIFKQFDVKYFNPDDTHRKMINCECIVSGQTNIMPYAADRVAFHGYKIYEKQMITTGKFKGQEGWVEVDDIEGDVDDLYKAAEGIDEAKPRPDLVIHSLETSIKLGDEFEAAIKKMWEDEGLSTDTSIEEWKKVRFKKFAPDWCKDDEDIFKRLCNDDKSTKLTEIKKRYPEYKEEMAELDKSIKKDVVGKIMEPLDDIFLKIGNELIDQLDGFINSGSKDKVTAMLKQDMESTVDMVNQSNSIEAKDKVEKSLQRLQKLGNKYNAAEGIVIMYKGRRMKFTGSFAPINQALGTRFMFEEK